MGSLRAPKGRPKGPGPKKIFFSNIGPIELVDEAKSSGARTQLGFELGRLKKNFSVFWSPRPGSNLGVPSSKVAAKGSNPMVKGQNRLPSGRTPSLQGLR
jgi:hypothetical protein